MTIKHILELEFQSDKSLESVERDAKNGYIISVSDYVIAPQNLGRTPRQQLALTFLVMDLA